MTLFNRSCWPGESKPPPPMRFCTSSGVLKAWYPGSHLTWLSEPCPAGSLLPYFTPPHTPAATETCRKPHPNICEGRYDKICSDGLILLFVCLFKGRGCEGLWGNRKCHVRPTEHEESWQASETARVLIDYYFILLMLHNPTFHSFLTIWNLFKLLFLNL